MLGLILAMAIPMGTKNRQYSFFNPIFSAIIRKIHDIFKARVKSAVKSPAARAAEASRCSLKPFMLTITAGL
jgi:hypothetical protein